jgi:predicted glycosyltransferase
VTRHRVTEPGDVAAIPRPVRPTALFGIFTVVGYGHLARCHRLAGAFRARTGLDTYVFGAHPPFSLGAPGVDEIDLPDALLRDSPDPPGDLPAPEQLQGLTPDMSLRELIAHKGRLLLALVEHLRPRAIVVDHFAFSTTLERSIECEPALACLRDAVPETLRCAGFRGESTMLGGAAVFEARRRLVEDYLDLVLVYVDSRERRAFFEAHPFLRPVESKVRFVGYVGPPPVRPAPRDGRGTRILATFGSGIDAYGTIRLVCDAFRRHAVARADATLEVVTGGGLPEAALRELAAAYRDAPRLRIARVLPALADRLPAYDLVVSRAGYNACVELYGAGTRSIVLPRTSLTRPAEQVHEARKFDRYGAIDRLVSVPATSPAELAGLIEEVLAAPPRERVPLDLGGARATAALLEAELERRNAHWPRRRRP